jgi:hypothetical protein
MQKFAKYFALFFALHFFYFYSVIGSATRITAKNHKTVHWCIIKTTSVAQ